MKTIELSIAIGASVGAAIGGLNSLSKKTSSIGKLVDNLGTKKIDLIAKDKNVIKLSEKLDGVATKLDLLKQKKVELSLELNKTKVDELNNSIGKIDDRIDKLRDKENLIKLRIQATTDEEELKKLNRSLHTTHKNITKLSSEKIELKDELTEIKEANEKVNAEIKKTQKEIDTLNSEKLEITKELKEAETQAEKTNRKISKIDGVINSINKSKIKIEAIVANRDEFKNKIMETVALASSVVIPLRTAINFESSLANVKKVTSFDDEGLANFGNKIIDLSNNKIPMAREQLLAISAEMAQLGIKDKHLLNYTTLTAKMSVAWDMEASDTGEAVGKMKNIFKLNLDGVKRVGDAINHLSNNTSAKASEMITAMKKVGGIANSFGMSAIKTTALVDTFIALGEEPENAATGINSLLGELNNIGGASKKAKKAFSTLGLSTKYFKNEIKANASGALMNFLERLKKVDKINRSAIAIDIFGKDHSPKILKLVDSLDEYKKALKLVDVNSKAFKIDVLSESFVRLSLSPKKSEKAIKDLAATFDNLDFKNDKIWEVFQELKIDDKKFKIKLDKDEDGAIDEFLKSIKSMDEAKQLKITTQLFGAEKAQKVLGQLQDVKDYKLKLDVSTESITKTINGLLKLDFNSTKMDKTFKRLGMSSKRFGMNIKNNIDEAFINLLQNLKKVDKATQQDVLSNLVGKDEAKSILSITGGIDTYLKKMKDVNEEKHFSGSIEREFQARSETTANSLQLLSNSFSSIGVNLGTLFLPAINGIGTALKKVSNGIGSFITEFPTLSKYVGGAVGGFVALAVGGATLGFALSFLKAGLVRTSILLNVFRGGLILNTVASKVKTVALFGLTVATKAYGIASTLAVGGVKMLGAVVTTVGRAMLLNPIGLAVTAIAGTAYLLYEYWEPVSGFFSSLWDGVKSVFSGAWEGIKTLFNWSPLGLLVNNWQTIVSFVSGIGTGAKNLLGSAWEGLKSIVSWNPIGFVSEKWNGLMNFFQNFSLADAGKKIITSVIDGMSATWQKLVKKVGDITKSIRDFFPFSPAKTGALSDIHKIKLLETVAGGLNEKPLLEAVNNTTKKVKKAIKDLDFKNDKIWEVFQELKIDDKKFKIKLDKDEDGAIDEFLKSIKSMDEAKQLKITTQLFGAEKAQKVLGQLQDVKDYKLKLDVSTESITKTINGLLKLDFNSTKMDKTFKRLGMSSKRFGMNIKNNIDEAFINLLQNLKKVDKATQQDVLSNLVGKDEAKSILSITGGIDTYLKKMKDVNEEKHFSGSIEREFQARSETTANSLQLLSNSFSSIGVNLGTLFLPAINGIGTALKKVSNGIGSFITEFPTLSKYVGGAVGGFVALAVGGATLGFALSFLKAGLVRTSILLNVFRGGLILNTVASKVKTVALFGLTVATKAYGIASTLAVGGVKMLGAVVTTVGRAMLLNPIGLAVTAIAGTAYLLYEYWEPVSGFFSSLWDGVKSVFSGAWEGIKTLFNWSPLGLLVNNWQTIVSFVSGIGTGAKNLLGSAWEGLKSIVSWNPIGFVSEKWNGLMNFFQNFSLADAGKKIITSVIDGMSATWQKLVKKVGDITKSIRDFFPFSPAKTGALSDIHKIKLLETVAGGLNEKPLLEAVNNTTKKVKKALILGSTGMAIGSQLVVANPAIQSPKPLPILSNRTFKTQENVLNKRNNILNYDGNPTPTNTKNIVVNMNFGDTHIHNDMDKEAFLKEVEEKVKKAIRDDSREQQSRRMYN